MIVGTIDIPHQELLNCGTDVRKLQQFAWRLVPPCARHLKGILDNQKYLVALELRNIRNLDYKAKMEAANKLLEGVRIQGIVEKVISVEDIFLDIDTDYFFKIIFEKELDLL